MEKNIHLITQLREQCERDLEQNIPIEMNMREKCDKQYDLIHKYVIKEAGSKNVYSVSLESSANRGNVRRHTYTVDARGDVFKCTCYLHITGPVCVHIYVAARKVSKIRNS